MSHMAKIAPHQSDDRNLLAGLRSGNAVAVLVFFPLPVAISRYNMWLYKRETTLLALF